MKNVHTRRFKMPDEQKCGFCLPPKEHQYQKGQSGNPNGRPRGARNRNTIVREQMNRKITLTSPDGNSRRISTKEGIIMKQINKALQGNTDSAKWMIELSDAADAEYNEISMARETLNHDDAQILKLYVKSHNGQ